MLFIIILLLMLIGSLLVFSMTRPREVSVPDLSGLTLEEAEEELEELNLQVGDIFEQNSSDVEAGRIIRTNPSPDAVLRESASVNLYVSLGEEMITLEDYENVSYEDARAELTDMGFTVEREDVFSNDISEGNVVSQSISAGEEVVPSESTITLEVSSGPEGFTLRRLVGYSSVGVEDYANDLNLSVTITNEPHDTIPEGQVARQSPEPGTTVYPGSRISVVFSTGPEEPEYVTFDRGIIIEYLSETGEEAENDGDEENEEDDENGESDEGLTPNAIEIYVEDAENSFDDVYRAFDIYEDTPEIITFVVEEGQTASFRIVRDGEVIREETGISPND